MHFFKYTITIVIFSVSITAPAISSEYERKSLGMKFGTSLQQKSKLFYPEVEFQYSFLRFISAGAFISYRYSMEDNVTDFMHDIRLGGRIYFLDNTEFYGRFPIEIFTGISVSDLLSEDCSEGICYKKLLHEWVTLGEFGAGIVIYNTRHNRLSIEFSAFQGLGNDHSDYDHHSLRLAYFKKF